MYNERQQAPRTWTSLSKSSWVKLSTMPPYQNSISEREAAWSVRRGGRLGVAGLAAPGAPDGLFLLNAALLAGAKIPALAARIGEDTAFGYLLTEAFEELFF